jgi:glycosyltransferase involved in cell wall biosynthesis
MNFFQKQTERAAYVWLLISLFVGKLLVPILILMAPLLRKRKPTKDFLFFPYLHKDNIGTLARVQEYVPMLQRDGYTFDIHYTSLREEYDRMFTTKPVSRVETYMHFHKVFWQRLRWSFRADDYKAVFVQRTMLPNYYDWRRPVLERLLHAYNDNVVLDYYDADYARDETFYNDILKYGHKVAVVNQFLFDYYSKRHPNVVMNELAVNPKLYRVKSDFTIHQPVRIFWTGSLPNAIENLSSIMPVLAELNAVRPLRLVMVAPSNEGFEQPFVEHHLWNKETFFDLLAGSDIALYPVAQDNDFSRGKVAYKSLEYAASKVPMVASPQGLSSRFVGDEDVLLAHNADEWKQQLLRLMNDESLRKRFAQSAYDKFMRYHEVNAAYQNLLKILNA